ncbi:PEK kinase [Babesia ovis]|uniref:non-specific serine/threonine protein kinase n=1 Tax=Babesia ovis TaxID=5869 RepID=A0A9W5WUS9_BABOV|nr:PEK kinase [Babesia ovis]
MNTFNANDRGSRRLKINREYTEATTQCIDFEAETFGHTQRRPWEIAVTSPSSRQTLLKNTSGAVRRVLVLLTLAILTVVSRHGWRMTRVKEIAERFDIAAAAHAEIQTASVPVESQVDIVKMEEEHSETEESKIASVETVSLIRRDSHTVWPLAEEVGGQISLIVLDTEGLAYNTNFSRNVVWVTRLTDNLLNVRKPYMNVLNKTCVPNNLVPGGPVCDAGTQSKGTKGTSSAGTFAQAGRKTRRSRHLVPSYDGFVYCVYETGHTQLLHIHVRDIVNFTPFRTPLLEGVYLEGSRHSSVMALDFETGSYIARNSNGAAETKAVGPLKANEADRANLQQLHIAYTDWTVHAFDELTHDELWSFNWREIGAVNSENTGTGIVERIREVIGVQGKSLVMRYDDERGKINEYMNFPFDIAAVFVVVCRVNEEITTLQLVERIAIPPPSTFLQSSLAKGCEAVRLSSSNYFGTNMLSVNDGIIDVPNVWDVGDGMPSEPHGGKLIEIKLVGPQHYTSETRLQPLTFTQTARMRWKLLKWHYVVRCWIITFIVIAVVTSLRIVRHFIDSESKFIIWWHKIPFAQLLSRHITNVISDVERRAFETTERWIYNVDRLSPMYSVDTVCRTFTVPLGILNLNERTLQATHLLNLISPGIRSLRESAGRTIGATEMQQVNVRPVDAPPSSGATTVINEAPQVTETESTKEDDLQSISVVPMGTALADFLENGRFLRTFDCIKLLGKGGFGSVYRAQHKLEPGNPTYAVKLVLLKLKASEGLTSKRYFREIAANREISSKYVVRYFTWWCEEPHFLPLAQLTAELQSAAAINVKYLVGTQAIDTQRTKALHGFMEHYQDMIRDLLDRSSEDSINVSIQSPDVAKLRKQRKPKLTVIGEQPGQSQSGSESIDSMLNGACNIQFEDQNEEHGYLMESESDQGIVFAYSETPQMQSSAVVFEESQRISGDQTPESDRRTLTKIDEQSYPVVLLILMELCRGFTLREWLNRPERGDKPMQYSLSPDGVPIEFDLFRQLIKGLRDIHANNFIHRDLKPENVFVDPNTNALKIGDFGLVGFISQSTRDSGDVSQDMAITTELSEIYTDNVLKHGKAPKSPTSATGKIIGTPGYTAPEGGFNCSEKADIFSAALILLELLSPRFSTAMERFAVLENFRNTGEVPDFIDVHLQPWRDLLREMGHKIPERRPSAVEIQKRLKIMIQNWNSGATYKCND